MNYDKKYDNIGIEVFVNELSGSQPPRYWQEVIMFEIIRDNTGSIKIISGAETKSWEKREVVLCSFSNYTEAEAYVLRIREYAILKDEDGELFIVPSWRRKEHVDCKVVAVATTYTNAQEMLKE